MSEINLKEQRNSVELKKIKNKNVPSLKDGKKARLRRTNYFVTINTNQAMTPQSEEAEQKIETLREIIRKIFNDTFIDNYVGLAEKAPEGSAITKEWIKTDETAIHWGPEIGDDQHRLHAHVGVFIPHYTKLRINEKKLLADLTTLMDEGGFAGFYFNSKYGTETGPSEEILREYVRKHPAK